MTITQTGEKLTGKYIGSYGESELTGSIKGRISRSGSRSAPNRRFGRLHRHPRGNTVKGTLTMGEMGEGTFTGKRK